MLYGRPELVMQEVCVLVLAANSVPFPSTCKIVARYFQRVSRWGRRFVSLFLHAAFVSPVVLPSLSSSRQKYHLPPHTQQALYSPPVSKRLYNTRPLLIIRPLILQPIPIPLHTRNLLPIVVRHRILVTRRARIDAVFCDSLEETALFLQRFVSTALA